MPRTQIFIMRAVSAAMVTALAPANPAVAQEDRSASVQDLAVSAGALKAAVNDDTVRTAYDTAGWHAMWSGANANTLDQALAGRERHGLERVEFLPSKNASRSGAEQDVARTRAALDYARALARGRADPASLHDVYTLPRPDPDLVAGLGKALQNGSLAAWLDGLAPQDDGYRQLSDAYVQVRDQARGTSLDKIAANGSIHVGDNDARVPAIVAALTEGGYLTAKSTAPSNSSRGEAQSTPPAAPQDQTSYTKPVSNAIEQLQRDYGIVADGIVGTNTLAVLNLGPGDRARALAVALERRRWQSRTPPATRIDVNTAAARLQYFRDGKLIDERRVIVGEPDRETPPLLAPIYRLVANPTWTVPKSIQNGELAHVGQSYLNSHNMVKRGGWIVQKSGPDNALGVVKFDMRNDQAIYLHDTSSRSLFDRSQRHLSHGCVRVEDAPGFARLLAEDGGISDQWLKAVETADQTFVSLPTEIPVRLVYQNVFIDAAGMLAFRTDPYGWNDAVAEKLGFSKGTAGRAKAGAIDVGP